MVLIGKAAQDKAGRFRFFNQGRPLRVGRDVGLADPLEGRFEQAMLRPDLHRARSSLFVVELSARKSVIHGDEVTAPYFPGEIAQQLERGQIDLGLIANRARRQLGGLRPQGQIDHGLLSKNKVIIIDRDASFHPGRRARSGRREQMKGQSIEQFVTEMDTLERFQCVNRLAPGNFAVKFRQVLPLAILQRPEWLHDFIP